jgi:hypothetical protein
MSAKECIIFQYIRWKTANWGGAKYMIISTSEGRRRPHLLVGEKNVEGVPSFTYLGALINSRNDIDQSILERTKARNQLRESLVLQLWEP